MQRESLELPALPAFKERLALPEQLALQVSLALLAFKVCRASPASRVPLVSARKVRPV